MKKKTKTYKYLIYLVLTTLLVLILALPFNDYINYRLNYKTILILSSVVNIIMYILYLYPSLYAIIGIVAMLCFMALYLLKGNSVLNAVYYEVKHVINAITWFIDYMMDKVQLNTSYAYFIVIAFIVVATIVISYFAIKRKRPFMVMLIGVALLSSMWYYDYKETFLYAKWYMALSLMLFSFTNYDNKQSMWEKGEYIYSKKVGAHWVVFTSFLLGIMLLFTSCISNDIKPINTKWIDETIISKINDMDISNGFGKRKVSSDRFDIQHVGYQEDQAKLGGTVKIDNTLMMKVEVYGNKLSQPYLRGAVKSIYTGYMWDKPKSVSETFDYKENIDNLLVNSANAKNYNKVTIKVYPKSISTRTIFNLWMPIKADVHGEYYSSNYDGELFMEKPSARGREYEVVSEIPTFYLDDLKKANYVPDKYNRYLQLPIDLPNRIEDLTDIITEDWDNNFDKAKAIEKYLRENYPYSLETSDLPEGRDFVDYFLFDEKKGYCTYFASAMAVMSRIAGIPSRYIEGFVINPYDVDKEGLYNVRTNRAHAWVELYFDGLGWVLFEPTPSYEATQYNQAIDTLIEDKNIEGDIPIEDEIDNKDQKKPLDEEDNMDDNIQQEKKSNKKYYIIISLVLALALKIAFSGLLYLRSIKKADKLDGKDAAMEYYSIFENNLKKGGIYRGEGETLYEFSKKYKSTLALNNIDIMDIVNTFTSVRYGNQELTDSMREKLKEAIKNGDTLFKNRKGTVKYLCIKYIL